MKKTKKALLLYQSNLDLSFCEICKKCKIDQSTLTRALQKTGIPLRNYATNRITEIVEVVEIIECV